MSRNRGPGCADNGRRRSAAEGLPTVEDALLDPGTLDAALEASGVPLLAVPLRTKLSRLTFDEVSWTLLDVRGVSGCFCGERLGSAARTVAAELVLALLLC